ncbi:PREDICTED: mitochondrial import inner membrane translocase subunit TIM23-3-like [Camelina sativa]|uniref:Mitochondrial import inner membrane translocase subunit TIM23-3-like n=1 Tax=Camelina sativa TaxID=90675 RepID=A0ABM0T0N2_CAMSA|nr:PREDICTED: mitochondrial import inner membrane translocase subunit TIM23-3-like [Camelina sativa]
MADLMNPSTGGQQQQKYRQYNPYHEQINLPYRQIYELPTSPEFLFEEEATKKRLTWGENLTFFTGCGYVTGSVLGAAKGAIDGIRGAERGESLKIRANRILNSGGLVGRRGGNCLGSLGLIFAAMESGVTHLRDGDDGSLTTVIAGLATGVLYRAARGPRSAVVAGVVGGVTAFAAVAGRSTVKRFVPI